MNSKDERKKLLCKPPPNNSLTSFPPFQLEFFFRKLIQASSLRFRLLFILFTLLLHKYQYIPLSSSFAFNNTKTKANPSFHYAQRFFLIARASISFQVGEYNNGASPHREMRAISKVLNSGR